MEDGKVVVEGESEINDEIVSTLDQPVVESDTGSVSATETTATVEIPEVTAGTVAEFINKGVENGDFEVSSENGQVAVTPTVDTSEIESDSTKLQDDASIQHTNCGKNDLIYDNGMYIRSLKAWTDHDLTDEVVYWIQTGAKATAVAGLIVAAVPHPYAKVSGVCISILGIIINWIGSTIKHIDDGCGVYWERTEMITGPAAPLEMTVEAQ
ncbi:hypothetical protein HARCEL1_05520 [Halococcoides cellulosivorans]|uniref:Uncharacterized protein n=1 Tax=Halococcoides cellulosivorans TaxID=1679096 RepID=A0A2R4X073_9EURY|nr:hypothetical protein HARCEL1_05520 [Halococcoides cellulosivorans]